MSELVFTLRGALDVRETGAWLGRLPAFTPGQCCVFDCEQVTRVDSSALALLLEAVRRARAGGGTLRVAHAPAGLVSLAGLYGLTDLLGLA